MTGWYSIVPAGAVAIGNLTPVGQNSGQVGCRWPPNGHQLAACLQLPKNCQLWGPFWHWSSRPNEIYLTLPQTTYYLETERPNLERLPSRIFRSQWQEGRWQVKPNLAHQNPINAGGEFLLRGTYFSGFWQRKELRDPPLIPVSQVWQTLNLSHNRRQNYRVVDEGGFFAEMVTFMQPGWSILVKIIGNYTPPQSGCLGAGATPVAINPVPRIRDKWLDSASEQPQGAVLLTGALWRAKPKLDPKKPKLNPVSVPYPTFSNGSRVVAYAAEAGVPWQSWKSVEHRHSDRKQISVLTPGEWLTPAGAVYLWGANNPVTKSEPLKNPDNAPDYLKRFNHWALGYGHLWLF